MASRGPRRRSEPQEQLITSGERRAAVLKPAVELETFIFTIVDMMPGATENALADSPVP